MRLHLLVAAFAAASFALGCAAETSEPETSSSELQLDHVWKGPVVGARESPTPSPAMQLREDEIILKAGVLDPIAAAKGRVDEADPERRAR